MLGLSLGNHPTALFAAPLVALSLGRRPRRWLLAGVGAALGLAIYAYLPLRAAAGPPLNWGNPRDLERFWWVVSGAPYRSFIFALPQGYLPGRLLAWAGLLARQLGVAGLPLAALGAATLWRSDRACLVATAATATASSAFAIGYNTTDSHLYLIPALLCLAAWLGVGASWLLTALAARSRQLGRAAAGLLILLPLATALPRFPQMSLRGDRVASDFGILTLGQAPHRAVILSEQDRHTFALWYFQHAHSLRSDVVVVDPGLLGYDWYREQVAAQLAAPWPAEAGAAQAAHELGRPVCHITSEESNLFCIEP